VAELGAAGGLLSLRCGGPWYAALPAEAWPAAGTPARAALEADLAPECGDRRQEIVFIGIELQASALEAALDECLATAEEQARGEALEDPFRPWPSLEALLAGAEEEDEEEEAGEAEVVVTQAAGGGPSSAVLRLRREAAAFALPPAGQESARIRGVAASFWPKMPCLACGSPWWRGDDWEAECANCGAGAEEYDDAQQPRPHRRAAFEAFRVELEAARRAGVRSLAHAG